MAVDSIDISALTTEYTVNEDKYRALALTGMKTAGIVDVYTDVKGDLELTELLFVEDIIQAWDPDFAPTAGAMDLVPRTLETEDAKVDLQITPATYRRKWMAKLMKKGWNEEDLPFMEYLLEKIMEKIANELDLGVWKYTKSGSDWMNGLKVIIATEITATNLTPVVTGVISVSNAIESLEAVYKSLPDAYREMECVIFVSRAVKDLYDSQYKNDNQSLPYNTEFKKTFLDCSEGMCSIEVMPGLAGSQRLLCTPADNVIIGVDLEGDAFKLKMEQNKRFLDIWVDFNYGVQIALLGAAAVNDQA